MDDPVVQRYILFSHIKSLPGDSAKHRHNPWGLLGNVKFATAEETAYPFPLAFAIARAFLDAALKCGHKSPPVDLSEASMHSPPASQSIAR